MLYPYVQAHKGVFRSGCQFPSKGCAPLFVANPAKMPKLYKKKCLRPKKSLQNDCAKVKHAPKSKTLNKMIPKTRGAVRTAMLKAFCTPILWRIFWTKMDYVIWNKHFVKMVNFFGALVVNPWSTPDFHHFHTMTPHTHKIANQPIYKCVWGAPSSAYQPHSASC